MRKRLQIMWKIIFHSIISTPLTDTANRSEGAVSKPLRKGERL